MSTINWVFMNIKWQHGWQVPYPCTFWYDVKKLGPHRALSQPGSRRHNSPAELQLGQFHSVRELITCMSQWSEKENTTTSNHWQILIFVQFKSMQIGSKHMIQYIVLDPSVCKDPAVNYPSVTRIQILTPNIKDQSNGEDIGISCLCSGGRVATLSALRVSAW